MFYDMYCLVSMYICSSASYACEVHDADDVLSTIIACYNLHELTSVRRGNL